MRKGKTCSQGCLYNRLYIIPDVKENSSFNIEDPIPELYIEIVKAPTRVVDFQLKTKDGVIFNPSINSVQFYWEFGCGHRKPQRILTIT